MLTNFSGPPPTESQLRHLEHVWGVPPAAVVTVRQRVTDCETGTEEVETVWRVQDAYLPILEDTLSKITSDEDDDIPF